MNEIYVVGWSFFEDESFAKEGFEIFGITDDKVRAREIRLEAERKYPETKGEVITKIYFNGLFVERR